MAANAVLIGVDGGAGLTGADVTINFSEVVLPNNTPAAGNWAAFGVSFDSLFTGAPGEQESSFTTDAIYNFGAGSCCETVFSIFFNSDVVAATFNAVNNGTTTTLFEALLNGGVVASFVNSVAINNVNEINLFWGFSGGTFDQIRINHSISGFGIDNLSYNVVPEPGTGLLLGLGLAGLGAVRRRA